MTVPQKLKNNFFERTIIALAILGPLMLVFIAGSQPLGSRGETIVVGDSCIAWCLVSALALRVAYELGITHARKLLSSGVNRSQHA